MGTFPIRARLQGGGMFGIGLGLGMRSGHRVGGSSGPKFMPCVTHPVIRPRVDLPTQINRTPFFWSGLRPHQTDPGTEGGVLAPTHPSPVGSHQCHVNL